MMRHSVIFKLKVAKNSQEEKGFFIAAKKLAGIPGVQKFECLIQTSKKNKFDFGLSMQFASQKLYDEIFQSSRPCSVYSAILVKISERFS